MNISEDTIVNELPKILQKMENKKFKVLMYGGHFVDTNKLVGEGAYITNNPYLYDADHTKEKIVETHKAVAHITGFTEEHFKNLERNLIDCRIVDVELVFGVDEKG